MTFGLLRGVSLDHKGEKGAQKSPEAARRWLGAREGAIQALRILRERRLLMKRKDKNRPSAKSQLILGRGEHRLERSFTRTAARRVGRFTVAEIERAR